MSYTGIMDTRLVSAYYAYAAERMKASQSDISVEQDLVTQGLTAEQARSVVGNLSHVRSEGLRAVGRRNMALGAFWCIGGAVVTALTYAAATGGDTYVVA